MPEPSEAVEMFDERTEAIQAQNARITWLVVTVALFVDVFWRDVFLNQQPSEYLDLLIILVLAVGLQAVLDGVRGVFTFSPREVRLVSIPGLMFGVLLYLGSEISEGAPIGEVLLKASIVGALGVAVLRVIGRPLHRRDGSSPPSGTSVE
ncbi:MAG TPA: hypothetical protein DGR79_01310 [Clostridiales bacterium]|nr:hypothetical protein [Clostridiales bacterium]